MSAAGALHVAHVLFRFDVGGMENGLVNLVNRLPERDYVHEIICLDDFNATFAQRIRTANVRLHALHKRPGNDVRLWVRGWRLLRALRPDVLHTRNFGALELQIAGAAARVPFRLHGEHGWDVADLDGSNRRHRLARRAIGLGVHRFVALSRHIAHYLTSDVGIPPHRVTQIYNGVDERRFAPRPPGGDGEAVVVGTVGRMQTVKNQTLLAAAFVRAMERAPELAGRTRLRFVGSGPLAERCRGICEEAGFGALVSFAGETDAVPDELAALDVFVLPSLAEGISNTILEAMATGLPVVATRVGGNSELVEDGTTGRLVAADDVDAMAETLIDYIGDAALRARHGAFGRKRVEERFGLDAMVGAYDAIYQQGARRSRRAR